MAQDDLYQVLGVSRSATAEEIRKAHRKLSMKFHPDKNKDDKKADENFKKVQEAYEVLSDDEKREQYDRFGTTSGAGGNPFGGGGGGGGGGNPFGGGGNAVDLGDLFGSFFGGGQGAGPGAGRQQRQARPQKGENITLEIEVPFYVAAEGGQHDLTFSKNGKRETISTKIPAGMVYGKSIRLAKQGHPGMHGGPPGDLMVKVKYHKHPYFHRDGHNLLLDLPISPAEAVLGTKVEVPTLSDGNVLMTVPPGTSSGAKLRLKEKGVLDQKTKKRGDQLVTVKIVVPKEPTAEVKELYEQLNHQPTDDPRANIW